MPTSSAPTRAGRSRAVALHAPGPAPLGRRARLRATAAAGGLAVLLGGSLAGHLAPASGAATDTVVSATSASLAAVSASVGAVARTGGRS